MWGRWRGSGISVSLATVLVSGMIVAAPNPAQASDCRSHTVTVYGTASTELEDDGTPKKQRAFSQIGLEVCNSDGGYSTKITSLTNDEDLKWVKGTTKAFSLFVRALTLGKVAYTFSTKWKTKGQGKSAGSVYLETCDKWTVSAGVVLPRKWRKKIIEKAAKILGKRRAEKLVNRLYQRDFKVGCKPQSGLFLGSASETSTGGYRLAATVYHDWAAWMPHSFIRFDSDNVVPARPSGNPWTKEYSLWPRSAPGGA